MDETPDHLIRMRADLMHAARIDTRAAKRRRGRIRLGGVAVAAVAAVALFAVGLPSGGGGGVAPHVDESLAGVLRTASINAAGQPALPIPGPGHYYHYTDTELGYISELNGAQEGCVTSCPPLPSDWGVKAWARSAMWISADGTALRTTSFGKPVIRNAQVRADLAAGRYAGASLSRPMGPAAATYFPAGAASGWSFGGMTLKQVYALPSDPAKLERIVRERAQGTKNPLNEEMFTVVGDIMRAAPLRPEGPGGALHGAERPRRGAAGGARARSAGPTGHRGEDGRRGAHLRRPHGAAPVGGGRWVLGLDGGQEPPAHPGGRLSGGQGQAGRKELAGTGVGGGAWHRHSHRGVNSRCQAPVIHDRVPRPGRAQPPP